MHHAHVLVRFVHLVVHPRTRSIDLSTLPKVLRDALYKQLGHLTGLQVRTSLLPPDTWPPDTWPPDT